MASIVPPDVVLEENSIRDERSPHRRPEDDLADPRKKARQEKKFEVCFSNHRLPGMLGGGRWPNRFSPAWGPLGNIIDHLALLLSIVLFLFLLLCICSSHIPLQAVYAEFELLCVGERSPSSMLALNVQAALNESGLSNVRVEGVFPNFKVCVTQLEEETEATLSAIASINNASLRRMREDEIYTQPRQPEIRESLVITGFPPSATPELVRVWVAARATVSAWRIAAGAESVTYRINLQYPSSAPAPEIPELFQGHRVVLVPPPAEARIMAVPKGYSVAIVRIMNIKTEAQLIKWASDHGIQLTKFRQKEPSFESNQWDGSWIVLVRMEDRDRAIRLAKESHAVGGVRFLSAPVRRPSRGGLKLPQGPKKLRPATVEEPTPDPAGSAGAAPSSDASAPPAPPAASSAAIATKAAPSDARGDGDA